MKYIENTIHRYICNDRFSRRQPEEPEEIHDNRVDARHRVPVASRGPQCCRVDVG